MSVEQSKFGEFFGGLIATAIGWAICMAIADAFYDIGSWAASWFGQDQHRDAFGVLSAIVFIWIYEREQAERRWNDLGERLDHIGRR